MGNIVNINSLFSFLSNVKIFNVTYISDYSMIIVTDKYTFYLNRTQHCKKFPHEIFKLRFYYNYFKYNNLKKLLKSQDLETRNLGLSLLIKEEMKNENDS